MSIIFRPRHLEITYDVNGNPIHVVADGDVHHQQTGHAVNGRWTYTLSAGQQTNLTNVLNAIKAANGF